MGVSRLHSAVPFRTRFFENVPRKPIFSARRSALPGSRRMSLKDEASNPWREACGLIFLKFALSKPANIGFLAPAAVFPIISRLAAQESSKKRAVSKKEAQNGMHRMTARGTKARLAFFGSVFFARKCLDVSRRRNFGDFTCRILPLLA